MNHKVVKCVRQHVTYISDKVPKETITRLYVQWTLWPGPPTLEALWKSNQQDVATKYIMHNIQDNICCMWGCSMLLEKYCVHMPCSLNNLMTSFAVAAGLLWLSTKIGPLSPCLPTAHHMVHTAGWSHVFTILVWIFRGPEPCVLLVHELTEVEMGSSTLYAILHNFPSSDTTFSH